MSLKEFAAQALLGAAGALTGGGMVVFLAGRIFHMYDQRIKELYAKLDKLDTKLDDHMTTMVDLRIKLAILERAFSVMKPFRKQLVVIQGEIATLRRKFESFLEDTYHPDMKATQERLRLVKDPPQKDQ